MEKQEILTERNIILEVLKKYRRLTYLWNPTHKLYTNKNARLQGLQKMLQSWRKLEPNASVGCIRKKINNWRAAYRRERKKVEDSYIVASEPDEFHKPNLWYYDYLTFISDDCPVLSKDDEEGGTNIGSDVTDNDDDDERGDAAAKVEKVDSEEYSESDDNNDEDESEEKPEKKPRMSVKRKCTDISRKPEFDDSTQVLIQSNDESSADLFGRSISSQLKEVSKFQRCLAEKLISEILFYAKLEQLTIGASVHLESSDI